MVDIQIRIVEVPDSDFIGADLRGASLMHLDLTEVNLEATRFERARVVTCAMEGISFPNADFHGAILRDTGLADVNWEGADLRDADLRGASFHMGSTRSGLVGSAVPCEGSKTGFYTDDFNDRDFKRPEEIRKANLCGADLRGAILDSVDFYLVDLRGAKYTREQRAHFVNCGAILS